MELGFEKELGKFNSERVIPAWDALVSRQQAALENLGVPTMYITSTIKERQVGVQFLHRYLVSSVDVHFSFSRELYRSWRVSFEVESRRLCRSH